MVRREAPIQVTLIHALAISPLWQHQSQTFPDLKLPVDDKALPAALAQRPEFQSGLVLLNRRIGGDKSHRGHSRLDLGVLATTKSSLSAFQSLAAEQRNMFARDLD